MPTISKTLIVIIVLISITLGVEFAFSAIYSWSGLIPLLAGLGGEIAFVGLWLEKEADEEDKREHIASFLNEKARNKLKSEIGWWVLMLGILVEILTAVGIAGHDVGESRQIAADIAKNDWRKHPIYAFSAKATVIVCPLEPVANLENLPRNLPTWLLDPRLRLPKAGNLPEERTIDLALGNAKELADNGGAGHGAGVFSDNVSESLVTNWEGKALALRYDIFFDEHSDNFFVGNFKPNEISGIKLLLPLRCEVLAGKIEMAIDGGLTNFTFQIPPQKSMGDMISSFSTNGDFLPINFNKQVMADFEKEAHANGWDVPLKTNVSFLYPKN